MKLSFTADAWRGFWKGRTIWQESYISDMAVRTINSNGLTDSLDLDLAQWLPVELQFNQSMGVLAHQNRTWLRSGLHAGGYSHSHPHGCLLPLLPVAATGDDHLAS